MLSNAFARATIPAEDIKRAIRFYKDTLGLKLVEEMPEGGAIFEAGKGSQILIYQRDRTKAEHTAITFDVDDLDGVLNALGEKGVKPEQYDMPGLKTDERGIASMGDKFRMAWITDPEGNILGFTGK